MGSHQPWNWYESIRSCRFTRVHQGRIGCPEGQVRGVEGPAKRNQGRVWWPDRHHLRYFQQASSWVLRSRVGAMHDRRCEHLGGRGQGTAEEAWDRLILMWGDEGIVSRRERRKSKFILLRSIYS